MSSDKIQIKYGKAGDEIRINYRVNGKPSSLTSGRYARKTLDETINKWNQEIGTKNEHLEITRARYVIQLIVNELDDDPSTHYYSNAIKFYRLKLSKLLVGGIFGLLSNLVVNRIPKGEKGKRDRTAFEFLERNPEDWLTVDEFKIWNDINELVDIDESLRKFERFDDKDLNHPFIFHRPDTLLLMIDGAFKNIVHDPESILFEVRNDIPKFIPLYRLLCEFENDNEKEFDDLSFYAYQHNSLMNDRFQKFKKDNKIDSSYLKEAFLNHPLLKEFIKKNHGVMEKIFTHF